MNIILSNFELCVQAIKLQFGREVSPLTSQVLESRVSLKLLIFLTIGSGIRLLM